MTSPSQSFVNYQLFFVAVKAVGPVILIELPSTVPVYFVVPAVNVISLPSSRP